MIAGPVTMTIRSSYNQWRWQYDHHTTSDNDIMINTQPVTITTWSTHNQWQKHYDQHTTSDKDIMINTQPVTITTWSTHTQWQRHYDQHTTSDNECGWRLSISCSTVTATARKQAESPCASMLQSIHVRTHTQHNTHTYTHARTHARTYTHKVALFRSFDTIIYVYQLPSSHTFVIRIPLRPPPLPFNRNTEIHQHWTMPVSGIAGPV